MFVAPSDHNGIGKVISTAVLRSSYPHLDAVAGDWVNKNQGLIDFTGCAAGVHATLSIAHGSRMNRTLPTGRTDYEPGRDPVLGVSITNHVDRCIFRILFPAPCQRRYYPALALVSDRELLSKIWSARVHCAVLLRIMLSRQRVANTNSPRILSAMLPSCTS